MILRVVLLAACVQHFMRFYLMWSNQDSRQYSTQYSQSNWPGTIYKQNIFPDNKQLSYLLISFFNQIYPRLIKIRSTLNIQAFIKNSFILRASEENWYLSTKPIFYSFTDYSGSVSTILIGTV